MENFNIQHLRDQRDPRITFTEGDVKFEFARSGGAGGQNVNKRETQAILYFPIAQSPKLTPEQKTLLLCHACVATDNPTLQKIWNRVNGAGQLVIKTSTERSQEANRRRALEILNDEINDALKQQIPRETKLPKSVINKRRSEARQQQSYKYKEKKTFGD